MADGVMHAAFVVLVRRMHQVFHEIQEVAVHVFRMRPNNVIEKILYYIFLVDVVVDTECVDELTDTCDGLASRQFLAKGVPHFVVHDVQGIVLHVLIGLHEVNHAANI